MGFEPGLWSVVLAAGSGTRLRALTTDSRGVSVPKQYCFFDGNRSMLRAAMDRAETLVSKDQVLTIVAAGHRRWWQSELAEVAASNVVVQPGNRGTAAGILLPLLEILRRNPEAIVVSFPSDHFLENEAVLEATVRGAVCHIENGLDGLILLGIAPDSPEPGYGWILPQSNEASGPNRVGCFVEKPNAIVAGDLMRGGGLWNSFVWVGRGATVVNLYARALPTLLRRFLRVRRCFDSDWTTRGIERLYETLPCHDFSADLLERSQASLWVMRVPACGWTDLGTPERVLRCLGRTGAVVSPIGEGRRLAVANSMPVVGVPAVGSPEDDLLPVT